MSWLVELNAIARPNATLVCFPFGGGNAGVYRDWAKHLAPGTRLVGIELPGHATRFNEPLLTRASDVVRALAAERMPAAPFVFFGHSLGALLAFELTRALARASLPLPQHLIVSGCGAPHLPRKTPPIHALTDDGFVAGLRAYEGTSEEVLANAELMELVLPILRADFAISETYPREAGAPIDVPMTVLGGDADPMVDAAALHEWRVHTRRSCDVRTFAGGHFILFDRAREIASLAGQLARAPIDSRVAPA